MLGFFGIGKQAFHIGVKQGFYIGTCLGLRRCKRIIAVKVVQVALSIYLAASGAAIAKPSAVEAITTPPRHERTEIFNSCLQSNKSNAKECVNVIRPRSRIWVDRAKLCKNGGTKGSASISATSFEVITPKEISANSSRQQNGSEGGEVFNDIIHQVIKGVMLTILVAWPIMWLGDAGPYSGMKPNVI